MKGFNQEKQIDTHIVKRKRGSIKKERVLSVVKPVGKYLSYVLAILVLIYIFFYSPFFTIKKIDINDLENIDGNEIVTDFLVLKGQNFFLTDLTDLRAKAIKDYAFIDNIYTEKVFPNRVVINVREKEPFISVENEEGCFLLDYSGFVLLEANCSNLKSNYSVKEVIGEDLNNMEFVPNSQSSFFKAKEIHMILNVLEHYDYSTRKIEIKNQVVTFYLHDDVFIVFSFSEDIDIQLKRLVVVQNRIDYDNIAFKSLDLRYERPILESID